MQTERLSFEADESPKELLETTSEQLVQDAEVAALKGLAKYVVPFGVKLAEKITPTEDPYEILTSYTSADKSTNTSTHRLTGNQKSSDTCKDGDLDR